MLYASHIFPSNSILDFLSTIRWTPDNLHLTVPIICGLLKI